MNYSFDTPICRRGTASYKWDSCKDDDVLPLWVADMDFATAPVVVEALRKRVAHGVFGYTRVPEAYYESVVRWFREQHGWTFGTNELIYTSGVVPALSAVIKALTKEGDKVVVQEPVYNCFFSSIRNNGCEVVSNTLLYNDGTYTIDYDDLERKVADPRVRLFLLCNPHNPAGRVWRKEELERMAQICRQHDVRIVADEIHCEIVRPGTEYVPFGSLPKSLTEGSVVCNSPSKAFNTAGLQIANIVCDDANVRRAIDRAININEVCDVNPFGVCALMAAYTKEGAEWLESLNAYVYANYDHLCSVFARELPQFAVTKMEGTYLVWVDCRVLKKRSEEIEAYLLEHNKVWLNAGSMYGEAGEGFMRINIACPRERLDEGLRRTIAGLRSLLDTASQG